MISCDSTPHLRYKATRRHTSARCRYSDLTSAGLFPVQNTRCKNLSKLTICNFSKVLRTTFHSEALHRNSKIEFRVLLFAHSRSKSGTVLNEVQFLNFVVQRLQILDIISELLRIAASKRYLKVDWLVFHVNI